MNLCKCGCEEEVRRTYKSGHSQRGKVGWSKGLPAWNKGLPSWNRGVSPSNETRQKMSLAKKGKPSCNKGLLRSEEAKRKNSEAHKGKHHTEETKQKMSLDRRGKPKSEEAIRNMSISRKGKPKSAEHIRKNSESHKGISHGPHSREAIEKMSCIKKRRFKEGKYVHLKFTRSKSEIEFGKQIEEKFGISLQHSKRLEGRVFDYCYESKKTLFELDGSYWHKFPKTVEIDKLKNEIAKSNGYNLIRYRLNYPKEVAPLIKEYYEELKELFKYN